MIIRNRGKKALYEVMAKVGPKPSETKPLEHTPEPEKPVENPQMIVQDEAEPAVTEEPLPLPAPEPEPIVEQAAVPLETAPYVAEDAAIWTKKRKMVQLNADRIDISIPYQLGIAVVLGLVLVLLVVFRLGQSSAERQVNSSVEKVTKPVVPAKAASKVETSVKQPVVETVKKPEPPKAAAIQSTGDNRIVLAQYHLSRDLEPIQKYFADNGIDTVIEKRESKFFLVTKNLYDNPAKAGTDGAEIKKKITDIGAGYKAPQGYESFAPKLFSDAYGEKVK
ncbi:MAG: hypothetical protein NTW55_03910 [Planctomycetota bacterium]|nr:hypothetical protein [Planctomycetota bacterium]